MAAVISVVQNAGQSYASYAQEVAKNISYLLPIDSATANKTANPLHLPSDGTLYSYEVYIRCRCDLAPVVFCNNFKAWYDSGLPASNQILTVNNDEVATYEAPVNIQSTRGTRAEFSDYDSDLNAIDLTGELVNVGDYTSWLVFQLEVSSEADTGSFAIEYTIQYDEA
jgi:hypothetical protein